MNRFIFGTNQASMDEFESGLSAYSLWQHHYGAERAQTEAWRGFKAQIKSLTPAEQEKRSRILHRGQEKQTKIIFLLKTRTAKGKAPRISGLIGRAPLRDASAGMMTGRILISSGEPKTCSKLRGKTHRRAATHHH